MTKTQKKRILAIIAKDCMTKGENINDLGRTCVVGALGIASGVSQKWLAKRATDVETSDVQGVMDGNLDPFVNAWLRAGCPLKRMQGVKDEEE